MHGMLQRLRKDWQRHNMSKLSPENEQTLTVRRIEGENADKRKRHSRKQKQCTKAWRQEKSYQSSECHGI